MVNQNEFTIFELVSPNFTKRHRALYNMALAHTKEISQTELALLILKITLILEQVVLVQY